MVHWIYKLIQKKTVCIRIGIRWRTPCHPIIAEGFHLSWVEEAKYLGVVFKSGKFFSCNWHSARNAYYKATNNILGVLGANPSIQVALALARASCIPIITYGLSAISLSAADLSQLAFAYNNIFAKLYHIKELVTIEQCQYYSGFWPFRTVYEFLRYTFLSHVFESSGGCSSDSLDHPDYTDFISIAKKYSFNCNDSRACLKWKVWRFLERSLF